MAKSMYSEYVNFLCAEVSLVRKESASVNPPSRTLTGCLHVPIVGPTGRSDWSVRLVGPTIVSCKRFVRPVGQTVGCLISSDCRSDCRSVWTLRRTGRTDWPVGRPITLQRRRYYHQLAGHIDLIDRCGRFGYSLSDRSVRLVWQTSRT